MLNYVSCFVSRVVPTLRPGTAPHSIQSCAVLGRALRLRSGRPDQAEAVPRPAAVPHLCRLFQSDATGPLPLFDFREVVVLATVNLNSSREGELLVTFPAPQRHIGDVSEPGAKLTAEDVLLIRGQLVCSCMLGYKQYERTAEWMKLEFAFPRLSHLRDPVDYCAFLERPRSLQKVFFATLLVR